MEGMPIVIVLLFRFAVCWTAIVNGTWAESFHPKMPHVWHSAIRFRFIIFLSLSLEFVSYSVLTFLTAQLFFDIDLGPWSAMN